MTIFKVDFSEKKNEVLLDFLLVIHITYLKLQFFREYRIRIKLLDVYHSPKSNICVNLQPMTNHHFLSNSLFQLY